MKPLDSDEEEAEQLGAFQKDVRKQANQSIQELSSALEQPSPFAEAEQEAAVRGSDAGAFVLRDANPEWSQKTQSEAVNQLKILLLKQSKEIPAAFSPPKRLSPTRRTPQEGRSGLHTVQDLVPMIHNQSDYIQHLEAEVKLCKEELQGMKQRVMVVVLENEKLQSQLKSRTTEETLRDFTIHTTVNEGVSANGQLSSKKWENEMEQLKIIYAAQIESLEAQVRSLRKELAASQKESEEVRVRLRHKEKQLAHATRADAAPPVSGLCLKCAQHDAVLAGTHTNVHVQAIERLTKERDELLLALQTVRASQQEAQQREWSACLQVKQAVEMAEEANLHKAKMEVQCEQLSRELGRQREQLERDRQGLKQRLSGAREEGRAESHKQKEELTKRVSNLTQRLAALETELDRTSRDKTSLSNQLDDAVRKLTTQEEDSTRLNVDLRYQLSQALLKKEEAERELRDLSAKTHRQIEKAAQEVERLNSELVGCRQHLEAVQRDGSQWQAEALSLAEQLANAQRQLHLTRQEKESAERANEERAASANVEAQEREQRLATEMEKKEAEHQRTVAELDGLLSSQNSLIRKLKEECGTLGALLEERSENSRSEVEQLSLERRHLSDTVKSLRARCVVLERQCVQHGLMHQRMKDRLQQLDRHCQSSAQQVCELLAKQNQLMHERNALAEETLGRRGEVPSVRRVDALIT
ncbi:serologically defined colon cancer antigen 8 homolog [Periophthalmus magnuspinnatus]|uniref:serologically defined colon cancer antigen 8 homolog n=1 Tax=Periophthalmus magnuspinnatus TaxID=409849 RepID=UPI00145AE4F0|nr:serologically defined colon cancer antigen 8 homolog [Periophthalmus magnuspinnatus]